MMRKSVLIVGGNSGIGAEVVKQSLAAGYKVHLALRKTEEISESVDSVQYYDALVGGESELVLPDVLDALIYCPGTIQLKSFHLIDSEQMRADMEVNVFGAARMVQAALPALKNSLSAGGASVVMFSSVAARTGFAFHASVSMAKGALEGLTCSLASELASAGVRVNAIAPGLTDTPLVNRLLNSDEKRAKSAARHPIQRIGAASGVASLVSYLVSDDAAFVTGQVFNVDGGMSSLR
ncbi:MAG: SDR family NAD(P)-dependent oxidoreductase [Akkermansiaceae bacterium]